VDLTPAATISCRYGFGVGGEYPMASASAAERSQSDEALRHRRGEQVVLTFSGQVSLTQGFLVVVASSASAATCATCYLLVESTFAGASCCDIICLLPAVSISACKV
jgi:hypothetical protein